MTDQEKKELVKTMIAQHRELQNNVKTGLARSADADSKKASEIRTCLDKFTKNLLEHLNLENNTFYVELLKNMKSKDQDTAKTEQFIAEMKGIEKAVLTFLDKYKDVKSIEIDIPGFHGEFKGIGQALNLRIEAEEDGVYTYWS